MKKIFTKLMLLAVAATALVSCENKIDESTPVVELTQTVTLTAEKPVEVRTEMIEGVPYWNAEDAIGVYTQTEKDADYYKFTNDSEETTLTTSFTGQTAVANTLFVFYPYNSCNGISADGAKVLFPATQSPTATSFDGAADIMLAKPVTLDAEGKQLSDLEFARVGAIVKIVLKDNSSSLAGQHISSLTMTAANNLVGRAYLDVENQELGKLYDSESKSVMATYSAASNQYEVNGTNATYVIVYPQTLEAGTDKTLTITASTEDYDIEKVITVPAGGIDLVQGAVTTLNVSLTADHITKRETVEWVDNAYNLVPSTTNLNIGDKVVFVAAASAKAMGAQNSNNRASVDVTKNSNNTVDIDSNVTVFTVVEGKSEGTFAFQSSEGYICAASSSSNYLRQETTLSANSSWSVNIAEGIATVQAQGSYTRNWLRFNPTNNPQIFSCYASGQADIAIYKLVGEYVVKVPAITMSVAAVSINYDATSGEATVTTKNGDGWAISATTTATWVSNLAYSNGKITFKATANDVEEARTATVTVTATKSDYDNVTTTFTITQAAKPAEGGNEGGDSTEKTVTHDFKFTTMGSSGWSNSYASHTTQYDESTVTFASASKQTQTITDMPVTKGGAVTLVAKNGATIKSATFKCKQWSSKAQTITLHYSTDGGSTYTTTGVTSSNFTISKSGLPAGTNAVKITFNSTSNQVGIESATITYVSAGNTGGEGGGSTPEPEQPEQGGAKTYTLTIGTSSFNTTSYAANNNEKTSTATAADGSTMQVKWTSYQVMLQSGAMQWQKNAGYIYNSTDLGTITSITINSTAGTFTKYINASKQPTTNGSGGYFQIKVGGATGKVNTITVTFTK